MPDNIRYLRGNPGKREAPKRVAAAPGAPSPPSWLRKEAAAEWRRIVPDLDRLGVLAKVDRAVIATYCEAWATFMEADRLIQHDGLVVEAAMGGTRKHPAWQIWRESATTVAALSKELFTSPNARLRSVIPDGGESDDEGADVLD